MKFMLSQSFAQVPVKDMSVQCRGLWVMLYGNTGNSLPCMVLI